MLISRFLSAAFAKILLVGVFVGVSTVPRVGAAIVFQEDSGGSNKNEKVKPENEERLELLLKTKFDRTPNGILKAWSAENVVEKKQDKKDKKQDPCIEAKITNTFKDFVFLTLDKVDPKFKKDQILTVFDQDEKRLGTIKLLTIEETEISAQVQPSSSAANRPPANSGGPSEAQGEEPADDKEQNKSDDASQTDSGSKQDTASDDIPDKPSALPELGAAVGTKVILKDVNAKVKAKAQTVKLKAEIADFSRDVTLGRWNKVKDYFANKFENDKDAQKAYSYLLGELIVAMPQHVKNGAQKRSQAESRGEAPPHSVLSPLDVLALAEASPQEISIVKIKHRKKSTEPDDGADQVADGDAASEAVDNNQGSSGPIQSSNPVGVPLVTFPTGLVQLSRTAINNDEELLPIENKSDASNEEDSNSQSELRQLAALLKTSIKVGYDMQPLIDKFEQGTNFFGGEDFAKRVTTAYLLTRCNRHDDAQQFVPAVDDQAYHDNIYALRIWKELAEIRYAEKREKEWLKTIWKTNQNIFGAEQAEQSDIDQALARLIDIAPLLDESIGQKWLDDSFTENLDRGVQLLSALGSISVDNLSKANQVGGNKRLKMIRLQNRAVEKLLEVAPEKASQWKNMLSLLAQNWIKEAQVSIDEAPNARRSMDSDRYGNYYWRDRSNTKEAIKIIELLPLLPSEQWQQNITPLILTDIKVKRAKLHMQIKEYAESYALIEELAAKDQKLGTDLAEEFLSVWTNINDANSGRNQQNSYRYYYGWNEKAESIPLTRSKQDRSLTELATWVDKIRLLPIEEVDQQLLVNAFVTVHSSAEVFQMERLESVFGDVKTLKPETTASLVQTMRQNLSGQWRNVKNQEQNKTKRKAPEIIREVLRGYQVAHDLTAQSLQTHAENWQLHLADASLVMDLNEFQQSLQKSSDYSELRNASMQMFANAAKLYVDQAEDLEKPELTTEVFDRWFYAALGAVDLGSLTAKTLPMKKEFAKIRQVMQSMSPQLVKHHMGQFANNLFARMSPVKPELKYRYLKHGFEIAGDHPLAWEAQELFQYYNDLTSEIKLDLQLDGSNCVGTELFGLYVNILHTQEIEREAGGFGKYATNQNQMQWAYNYGRPTENYRDKFVDSVQAALGEHFEVESVTFMGEKVMESRPTVDRGWRVTPYAYIALRATGSQVDRVSPISLDMDFLDTSGYVVVPVESPELVIDCASEPATRPVSELKLTRTLDERQIDEGKLILEISATGKGLIPDLDEVIELELDDFQVVNIVDQGCLPTAFDTTSPAIQIKSDRSWSVEYQAKIDTTEANEFVFSEAKIDLAVDKIQRYQDADLIDAESVVRLETDLSKPNYAWMWYAIPVIGLALMGGVALVMMLSSKPEVRREQFAMPEEINAFTVLSLLKNIQQRNGINVSQQEELSGSINRIEKYYFGQETDTPPEDLESLASVWLTKVAKPARR